MRVNGFLVRTSEKARNCQSVCSYPDCFDKNGIDAVIARHGHRIQEYSYCHRGCFLGALIAAGFPMNLVIMSDDAGQFDIVLHGL